MVAGACVRAVVSRVEPFFFFGFLCSCCCRAVVTWFCELSLFACRANDVAGDAGGGMSFVQRQEMNSKIAMENKRQIIRREQLYGACALALALALGVGLSPAAINVLSRVFSACVRGEATHCDL